MTVHCKLWAPHHKSEDKRHLTIYVEHTNEFDMHPLHTHWFLVWWLLETPSWKNCDPNPAIWAYPYQDNWVDLMVMRSVGHPEVRTSNSSKKRLETFLGWKTVLVQLGGLSPIGWGRETVIDEPFPLPHGALEWKWKVYGNSVNCGMMKYMVYRHHFPVLIFMSSASSFKTLHYETLQQMTLLNQKWHVWILLQ